MKKWLALLYVLWLATFIFSMVCCVVNNNRMEEMSRASTSNLGMKLDYELFRFVQELNDERLEDHGERLDDLRKAFKSQDYLLGGEIEIMKDQLKELMNRQQSRPANVNRSSDASAFSR
jgi:hypothetical protein